MAKLPILPDAAKSHIEADPATEKYVKELRQLANKALDLDKKVSAEVRIGKVTRVDDDLYFSIIVKMLRGGKGADTYRIESIAVDDTKVVSDGIDTDSKGEYSFAHSCDAETTHVTVDVNFTDNRGDKKSLQKCLEVERVAKRQADKLRVTIPGIEGLQVNKVDEEGFFFVRLTTTYKGQGLKANVDLESEGAYDLICSIYKNSDNQKSMMLPLPDDGSVLIRLKPWEETQTFIFSLPGTDQVVKVTYKKVVKKASKLIVTVPGADKNNIVHEPTAPNGGFIVNLQTEDESEDGLKDTVNSTSGDAFAYRVGTESPKDAKSEHDIKVNKIKTIIVLPTKSWQKITFVTANTVPQTFEFRKLN